MSSSISASSQVYTGFWINWTQGPVNGATITLSRSNGTTLIAFIAFFVAWAGTCFWRIVCFFLHYASSSPGEHDGLFHQQQAILRNASEPESGLRLSAMLYLYWRRRARKAFWRLFSVLIIALTCVVVGSLASLFSPRISEIGDEVLVSGGRCAAVGKYDDFPDKQANIYDAYYVPQQIQQTTQIENAASYAQQCYSSSAGKEAECDTFVQRRLPISTDMNATCPFDSRICKTQDRNLVLDTGYLDSHEHLGINSRPEDRFLFRRKISCAPLVTEGHRTPVNTNNTRRAGMAYNYGPLINGNPTYFWDNATRNTRFFNIDVTSAFYADGELAFDNTFWNPSRELHMNKTDATLFIFWLSTNQVPFTNRTDDPWYNASIPSTYTNSFRSSNGSRVEETVTQYLGAEYASPLGCKLQDQFCNPNKPRDTGCSDFGGWVDNVYRSFDAFDNDYGVKLARVGWFTYILGDMVAFHQVVRTLKTQALASRFRFTNEQTQAAIPDNQWMMDVRYWLEVNLAAIQGAAVLTAMGAPSPEMQNTFSRKPNNTQEHNMCENQKIRSKDHTSFSVVGLGVTFGVGLLIVILSYLLDPIMTCLQRRRGIAEYKRLKWSTDAFLQLQRLAYEGAGQGTWSYADGDVPVTKKEDMLAGLNVTDPGQPRIASLRLHREPTLGLLDKSTVYTRNSVD